MRVIVLLLAFSLTPLPPLFVPIIRGRRAAAQVTGVALRLTSASARDHTIHWTITNHSGVAVFVFDTFLFNGPYQRESVRGTDVFETGPVALHPACYDRFAPVLLLAAGAYDSVEGVFRANEIAKDAGKKVQMTINVGVEPYAVIENARRAYLACDPKVSPYDVIYNWSTVIHSNTITVSP